MFPISQNIHLLFFVLFPFSLLAFSLTLFILKRSLCVFFSISLSFSHPFSFTPCITNCFPLSYVSSSPLLISFKELLPFSQSNFFVICQWFPCVFFLLKNSYGLVHVGYLFAALLLHVGGYITKAFRKVSNSQWCVQQEKRAGQKNSQWEKKNWEWNEKKQDVVPRKKGKSNTQSKGKKEKEKVKQNGIKKTVG